VIRLLGEGGMGAVYEAEHTIIARRVAVKVLHARFCQNAEALTRFTREARAAASIGHENIVDVTDFGVHNEQPFLVMEILKGEALSERMAREANIPVAESCAILGAVLSALASAHAIGVVHRDLKPENIFLASTGARTVVKILDFGVSKFRHRSAGDKLVTQEGAMFGTPNYMAPEQWLGERDVDHRADLYAAGVLLYEMLTGGLPYEGDNRQELMLEVVVGKSTPPAPSTLLEGIPAGLDAVALKAVSRAKDERFQTAQDFLDALRPYGAADIVAVKSPPSARPPSASSAEVPRVSATRAEATLSDSTEPLHPLRPNANRRFALALGAAGFCAALLAVMIRSSAASRAPAPPPPPPMALRAPPPLTQVAPTTVRVELRGVPEAATVRVDGAPHPSREVVVERGSTSHHIAVELGDARRTFVVTADADQVLMVDLTPAPAARTAHHTHATDTTSSSHAAPPQPPSRPPRGRIRIHRVF
jgi:serine/threonine-protein kinase